MNIGKKLFFSFLAVIALNLLLFTFVFEDIIVEQLKNDRHNQYREEKDVAQKVRFNQLIRQRMFKDPIELRELSEQLPEDLMYKMVVTDASGNAIFSKTSQALTLKIPDVKNPEKKDLKVVGEYHFQHDPPNLGQTIVYFYTDDSDILATKGVSMMLLYIYGSIVLVGLVLVYFLVRWILRPVNELSRVTQEIREGKRNVSFSYTSNDEFARLFRYFTDMVAQLRFSEERQQELISAIAHDFRTPLTTIKGYASYIGSGRVTDLERIQKQMGKIEEKATDLEKLLDELQDFSQQSAELTLEITRIHLKTFVINIAEDYVQKTKEAVLQFQWKVRVSNELYIEADETKIRRVLENLLNNAIYYNKPNGSILLTCDQRDGQVLFSVIDKGEGIATEDLPKVFTRFYRAEKSRNRNRGGTGLGLTICQSIVERHRGEITVTSELGEGSCFSFTIPFYQP